MGFSEQNDTEDEREGRENAFSRPRTANGTNRATHDELRQKNLSILSSASKVFASSMRTTIAERQRMAEERALLLAREKAARVEAEASKEQVTRILESITDAFCALDRECRFAYVNRRAEQLFGKPREELLGKTLWEESPWPEGSEPYREIKRVVEAEVTTEFEAFIPALDSWISGRAYPSPDGISVYFQDITDRNQAEAANAHLAAVVRASGDAVAGLSPDGTIESWNPAAERLFGYAAEEAIGRPISLLAHPDKRAEQAEIIAEVRSGKTVSLETMRVAKDGHPVYVTLNKSPIMDAAGRVTGISATLIDITERKRAEEELRESEERLRTVVNNAPVVLFALDREGVLTLSTGRGLEVLGLKPNELVGQSVFEVYAGSPPILEDVRRALAGEAFTATAEVDNVTFEIGYAPLRDGSGEVESVIGVATDITERKKAEQERDRFLAREWRARAEAEERKRISRELHDRVAHSMAVVHQSLELYEALRDRDPEQAGNKLMTAREMTKTALESTRDLSLTLRNEVEDGLAPALSDLLSTVVPPDVRTEISVEGDDSLAPQEVRDQLFLILREGVRNAVSHSGAESIKVAVEITPEKVCSYVEDDGRGFDPQGLPPRRGGGLRSMKERAALVGGSLRLKSAPDGTKIEVTIPLSGRG